MALKVLHKRSSSDLLNVKEVCEQVKCSYDGMARVMQVMGHDQKILISEQGISGGYRLNCDLSQLSMYQLMEVVMGRLEIAKCIQPEGNSCQMINSCNIVHPVRALNSKIMDFYKTLSVEEIISVDQSTQKTEALGV